MPRFNKQGPMGQGPMTGRRMGPCAETAAQQAQTDQEVLQGRGFGRGRMSARRGGGCGRGFGPAMDNAPGRGLGQGRGRAMGRGFGRGAQGSNW